jgi:hypothetical protein
MGRINLHEIPIPLMGDFTSKALDRAIMGDRLYHLDDGRYYLITDYGQHHEEYWISFQDNFVRATGDDITYAVEHGAHPQ